MGKRSVDVAELDGGTDGSSTDYPRQPTSSSHGAHTEAQPSTWTLSPQDVPDSAKKIYCVLRGHKPGFYFDYYGSAGAEEQVRGFRDNLYVSFPKTKKGSIKSSGKEYTIREALSYMNHDATNCTYGCGNKCPVKTPAQGRNVARISDIPFQPGMGPTDAAEPDVKTPSFAGQDQVPNSPGTSLPRREPRKGGFCRRCQKVPAVSGERLCQPCRTSTDLAKQVHASAEEFALVREQRDVLDLVAQGANIFLTGAAGTGKSRVLGAILSYLKREELQGNVIAPTGIAALAVGGSTIHTYAGLSVKAFEGSLEVLRNLAHKKKVWKRFSDTDVLIIDEISMVESDLLTRLSVMMTEALCQGQDSKPFGGVQVIITGDFSQLPPVLPFKTCIDCGDELKEESEGVKRCQRHGLNLDENKWAFCSPVWAACKFENVHLRQVHRQANAEFADILQKIRKGAPLTEPQAAALLSPLRDLPYDQAVKLSPLRWQVEKINETHLRALPTQSHMYECVDDFSWQLHHPEYADNSQRDGKSRAPYALLEHHRYESCLELKEGMRVLLLANLDIPGGLVNGTQGQVIGFEEMRDDRMPRAKSKSSTDSASNGEVLISHKNRHYAAARIRDFRHRAQDTFWPVVQFDNGVKRTIFADCSITELGKEEPYSLLSRTQVPLIAGYAISIHKSQGMTLENVVVNLDQCFAPGQAYVALSRAKTLSGITVQSMPPPSMLKPDSTVEAFMEATFGRM